MYNRVRANQAGKKVFKVKSLKRICFASSEEQCEKKFQGHVVMKCGLIRSYLFLIFGI